jgi:transposase
VTATTLSAWHKRWREQGLAELRDGKRSGGPAKTDRACIQALQRWLDRDPRLLGLPFTIGMINRLRLSDHFRLGDKRGQRTCISRS